MRITPRGGTRPEVVQEGILTGLRYLRVMCQVERPVEERMRIEAPRCTHPEVVRDRIEVALTHLGSLCCVVVWIEQTASGDQRDVGIGQREWSKRLDHPPHGGAKTK